MAATQLRSHCLRYLPQLKSRVFVGSCVATLVASCSLRNLDELDRGWGEGGSENSGGSSSKGGGVTGATAGTGNVTSPASGGSVSTGSGGTTADPGTTAPTGGVSTGGQAATTTTGSAVASNCPAATARNGKEIYSYGFEAGLGGWERTSGRAGVVTTDVSACEGGSYFTLDGALRSGGWDGPAYNFFSYATLGSSYHFSIAVRFNRKDVVAAGSKTLSATIATYCESIGEAGAYTPLTGVASGNEWTRIETLVPFVYRVPSSGPSCTTGVVTRLTLYIETLDADVGLSIDVDDVHIWEVAGSGTGGAGGGGGMAGAAGSAGMAGAGGNAGAGGS